MQDADRALKLFELNNRIVPLGESDEKVYCYDHELQKRQVDAKPWKKDVQYYNKVEISSIALVKMVMHARSGGDLEVMGMMLGKVMGRTMVVLDAFALPVEGSETRVNAHEESYTYLMEYLERCKQTGQNEPVIGWYHSHPGYGCWLSGIDVETQMSQQMLEPALAVVIDPKRTMSAGRVDLGAFRTYPTNQSAEVAARAKKSSSRSKGLGDVPLSKIDDFGVHSHRYYPLEVSYFKSSLDQQLMERLWRKHWINTLSQSPLITNDEFTALKVQELAGKVDLFNQDAKKNFFGSQIQRESDDIAEELTQGHASNDLKRKLFG